MNSDDFLYGVDHSIRFLSELNATSSAFSLLALVSASLL